MNRQEVKQLMAKGIYDSKPIKGVLEETNISWVILSRSHAFKIKKEIKLSFLDYSTLELRKKYCEKELELNRRFSSIYLSVQPITYFNEKFTIGEGTGEIVDYVVCMKRMRGDKRMDVLLTQNKVDPARISLLAKQVANFHQCAEIIKNDFNQEHSKELFNDLNSVHEVVLQEFDPDFSEVIPRLISFSDDFLKRHAGRFGERNRQGFRRDVHGDLHSGNIFLYEAPVIFDCIEFQDAFRQIDILYEVAFLCMDLEFFGRKDLSDLFLGTYESILKCFPKEEDKEIFFYFKCLRANVRAKVFLLNSKTEPDPKRKSQELAKGKKYLELALSYKEELNRSNR
ncbi:phosphotransferase [Algoriphagus marinus]|uniref:phosphotransferase n=1 Tax=Algoriphagus marinus TaxID=1925762 RepID=UPI00094BC045|nr:phosphotransferase [Algoriphagus marinus]